MEIAAQIVGVIGIIVSTLIFQQKTRRSLIAIKLLSDVIWTVHYALLEAYGGMAICIIAIFREIVFINRDRHKWANHIIWPITFISIAIGSSVITWKGLISVLPTLASVISIIAFYIGKPALSRILAYPISSCMVVYDVYCASYTGLVNELLSILSSIIGIIRLDRKNKKKNSEIVDKELSEAPKDITNENNKETQHSM